jgi:phospholipid/cholesterol/gamma-HCH transport system substrate-binding protein
VTVRTLNPLRALLLPVALAALVIALTGSGGDRSSGNHVFVVVRDANSFIDGQLVRAAGRPVGRVTRVEPIERGRRARVRLRIDDDVWPLTRGTKVSLRWGGTVSFLNRYIDLQRGRVGAPQLRNGATIPARDTNVPVEFDELFASFDAPTRRRLKSFLDTAGPALAVSERPLRASLRHAPPAVTNASAVIGDLGASERSLDTLVGATANVVNALHRSDPALQDVIGDTGSTLGATAAESTAIRTALHDLPSTLMQTRAIAARATRTLNAGDRLLTRLEPGVTEARRLPEPLNDLLSALVSIEPDATATLARVTRDAPSITRLARRATSLLPTIDGVARQGDQALNCIRPYAPEVGAFFSNWGDFISQVDGKDHLIRANIQAIVPAPAPVMPYASATAVKTFPGLRYAFPRPPGYNADQPWFLPECRAGRDALDPTKDPESRPFPISQLLPSMRKAKP